MYLFIRKNANFLYLFFIFYTVYSVFWESDSIPLYCWLYWFFIGIHDSITTLEFEEYYLMQLPFWESVEYNIVTSLPNKNHILRCVWKIRKCGEYFLIDFTEYAIARSLDCTFSDSLMLSESDNTHDKNPNNKTNKSSEYECQWVHSIRRRR